MTYGHAVKKARAHLGLSQQALAERVGTSRARISSYESEKSSPTLKTMSRIADQVNLSVEVLRKASASDVFVPTPRRLEKSQRDEKWSLYSASRSAAEILEAESCADGWGLDFYEANKIIEGQTVEGGLGVDKARRAWRVMQAGMNTPQQLRWFSGEVLIEPSHHWTEPYRAMWFMAQATIHGADPVTSRLIASSHLCHLGYPWVHIPYGPPEKYEIALSELLNGNATKMVRLLEDSIPADWTD